MLFRFERVTSIHLCMPHLWFARKKSSMQCFVFCGWRACLVPIFIEHFVHSIKKAFCREQVCLNGYRSSKNVAQVSVMKKEPEGRPHPRLMTTLKVHVNWFCRIDGWHWIIRQIICESVMTLFMQYSAIDLGFEKFIRDGTETTDEEANTALHSWHAVQSKTFFNEGMRKLFNRWAKCIEKLGDYVEKWGTSFLKIA